MFVTQSIKAWPVLEETEMRLVLTWVGGHGSVLSHRGLAFKLQTK